MHTFARMNLELRRRSFIYELQHMPCRNEKMGFCNMAVHWRIFLVRRLLTQGIHRLTGQGEEGAVCNVPHKLSWTLCVFDDREV